jgi:hypothetical protein
MGNTINLSLPTRRTADLHKRSEGFRLLFQANLNDPKPPFSV